MAVNNALKEVPSAGAPINFVMNEAAIPAEAFLDEYDPRDPTNVAPGVAQLLNHARKLGYPGRDDTPPVDAIWQQQEQRAWQKAVEQASLLQRITERPEPTIEREPEIRLPSKKIQWREVRLPSSELEMGL
jgi:hypothetical protein